jgi:3-hydroxyisobutyrate dehydrogenase-like beta-hydroxyacid dehydrogenase
MISTNQNPFAKTATIIGLGSMGSTLARLLLQNGYHVTVWNRTTAKAAQLVAQGAVLAPSIAAAIAASPIIVVCVYDYPAAHEIFNGQEMSAALAGRLVIQLTTGSPQDARASERWAHDHGADYLDGAIQAAPTQMARADTTILISGAESAFRRGEALLSIFGGNIKYLDVKVSAAAAMDLATLSYVYGAVTGFFHGALICEAEGFRVDTYGQIVSEIAPSFGDFLKHEGNVIHSGNYAVSESPLSISVEATERLAETARATGINTEFPTFVASLFRRAHAAGYGGEEAAAVMKVLRSSKA